MDYKHLYEIELLKRQLSEKAQAVAEQALAFERERNTLQEENRKLRTELTKHQTRLDKGIKLAKEALRPSWARLKEQLYLDLLARGTEPDIKISYLHTKKLFFVSNLTEEDRGIMERLGGVPSRLGYYLKYDGVLPDRHGSRDLKPTESKETIFALTYNRVKFTTTNDEEHVRTEYNRVYLLKAKNDKVAKRKGDEFLDVKTRRENNDPTLPDYIGRLEFVSLERSLEPVNVDLTKQPMFEVETPFNYEALGADPNYMHDGETIGSCVLRYLVKLLRPYCRAGSDDKKRYLPDISEASLMAIISRYRASSSSACGSGKLLMVNRKQGMSDEDYADLCKPKLAFISDEAHAERDEELGITPEEVDVIARTYNVSHICCDVVENILMRSIGTNKNVPAIMYITNGKHLYPIWDKFWKDSLAHRGSYSIKQKIKQRVEQKQDEEIDYSISPTIEDGQTGHVILTDVTDLKDFCLQTMLDTKTVFKQNSYDTRDENMTRLRVNDNLTYYVNPDAEKALEITKKLGVPFTNQSLSSIFSTFCEENDLILSKSVLRRDFYNALRLQPHGGINTMFSKPTDLNRLVGYDYNKLYSHLFGLYKFPVFSPFDEFQSTDKIDPKDPSGTYYRVEWDVNLNVFDGPIPVFNGLWVKPVLEYLISIGRNGTITSKIVPDGSMPNLKDFVSGVYDKIGNNAKDVINKAVGTFGTNKSRKVKTWFDVDALSAFNILAKKCKSDNAVVLKIQDFFQISEITEELRYDTNMPANSMIVQLGWVFADMLFRQMGGKLIRVITDCVITEGGRGDLAVSDTIGGIKVVENSDCQAKVKGRKVNLQVASHKVAGQEVFVRDLEPVVDTWNVISETEETDSDELAQKVFDLKGGLITGLAGCGKTYLTKKVIEILDANNIKYLPVSYTNCGAILIDGETIHRSFGLSITSNIVEDAVYSRLKANDWLVVDEISMLPHDFYKVLLRLQSRGVKILLVGDYNQIKPVMENRIDPFVCSVVKQLCNGNMVQLNINRRSDPEMSALYRKILDGNFTRFDFQVTDDMPSLDEFHITYRNVTCDAIARYLMRTKAKTLTNEERLRIPAVEKKDVRRKISMWIWRGCPLRGFKGDRKLGIVKNLLYHVVDWSETDLFVIDERDKELVIPMDLVKHLLEFGLVSTAHKVQGRTLKGRIRIWEWDFIRADKHWLYTSVSRTVGWKNVFLSGLSYNHLAVGSQPKFYKKNYDSLTEKWDLAAVKEIIAKRPCDPKVKPLYDVLKQADQNGKLQTTYHPSTNAPYGRLYAHPSLQGVPGYIRRMCSHKFYHDIDMENCYPVILLQIAERNRLVTPNLRKLVENREAVFAEIMDGAEIDRKTLKICFLSMMHSGRYQKVTEVRHPILESFQKEVRFIAHKLFDLPVYRDIVKRLEADSEKSNKFGSFISLVCQEKENELLHHAKAFFEQNGYTVGVLVFDGLMVERKGDLPPSLLIDLSQYVHDCSGFVMKFTEKSLTPTAEDYLALNKTDE